MDKRPSSTVSIGRSAYEPSFGAVRTALSLVAAVMLAGNAMAQMPAAIATPEEATVVTLHAEGAQIYECKAGSDRKLVWVLREPIATLLLDGKTVGRHYAGPSWEHMDGSAVAAKVVANAPGRTPNDISWLKLRATARRGQGTLSSVTTVQQTNTQGGIHTVHATRPEPSIALLTQRTTCFSKRAGDPVPQPEVRAHRAADAIANFRFKRALES